MEDPASTDPLANLTLDEIIARFKEKTNYVLLSDKPIEGERHQLNAEIVYYKRDWCPTPLRGVAAILPKGEKSTIPRRYTSRNLKMKKYGRDGLLITKSKKDDAVDLKEYRKNKRIYDIQAANSHIVEKETEKLVKTKKRKKVTPVKKPVVKKRTKG